MCVVKKDNDTIYTMLRVYISDFYNTSTISVILMVRRDKYKDESDKYEAEIDNFI